MGAAQSAGLPLLFSRALAADTKERERILVILEMSGGNDGLNTLVPYSDDAYYRHRPKIGIRPDKLRKIDQRYGFNGGMAGFERLYKDGRMAIVHGCGYAQPSFSHFTSMAYWHTGAPNSGEEYGWVGRVADAIDTRSTPNFIVNIDEVQSLAVRARDHVPVVFDDPEKFGRKGLYQTRPLLDRAPDMDPDASASKQYLLRGKERTRSFATGARRVVGLQNTRRLRHRASAAAENRFADRSGHAHAAVLHVVSPQCLRHSRATT